VGIIFTLHAVERWWPAKRDWKVFKEWFEIEINSEVFDLVDGAVEKEEHIKDE